MPDASTPLANWLNYISAQHSAEIVMGLTRVRAVWERMQASRPRGTPEPIRIVVGGTNGKGSTCAMLESILNVAGYKTGLYTSPHLLRYNERVRVAGHEAGDADLTRSLAAVNNARRAEPEIALTYFEFATLSALWLFAEQAVEVEILEVGLGGRLDAVNIVDADVSIVVSVDLDHQAWLGETREAIAWEKAHIYRAGRAAIFADREPPATLVEHARAIGADFITLGEGYGYTRHPDHWQWDAVLGGREVHRYALPFPALRGAWQLKNASAALTALAVLEPRLPVSLGQIKQGLLAVRWPARLQVLPGSPEVVLDVAHNPHAAAALADALGALPYRKRTLAVFGMLQDKDIDAVIAHLKPRVDAWFVAGLAGERGASGELMAQKLSAAGLAGQFTLYTSIGAAFSAARATAESNDRILVFGSFLTVADVMRQMGHLPT